ncbi:M14 family metallopeptidase [Celerinatantimonas diazotrophica]|uniref:Zinc carboxypeptidase n=1 Tax=Celerinatantimonas diazotrophica TaxID=412034 RepID=A0A4R1KC10_9GAMM|nr:peptidase M14 [Celerinatantimonas diazotrophica]TCK61483.1 hypothetical protein EV690_0481 [Celerinatantimonas diazotrophica]CAG9296946.1 hypothetical protein CEDIAZO_02108 [Celerinatantimonas diazotrophica]
MALPEVILQRQFRATIEWLAEQTRPFKAWVFADQVTRRRVEYQLKQKGIEARIYSAYKPLVHYFLEDAPLDDSIERIRITYPAHPSDRKSKRFLLEAFPLAGLLEKYQIEFRSKTTADNFYEVMFFSRNGDVQVERVFAPNKFQQDHTNEYIFSPCGWIQFSEQEQFALKCDVHRLFEQLIGHLQSWTWPEQEPYFDRLKVHVDVPFADLKLKWGEEHISFIEALHEDIYFSLIEFFNVYSGREADSRELQPGQIVPEVCYHDGPWQLQVTLEPYQAIEFPAEKALSADALAQVSEPLTPNKITATLTQLTQDLEGQSLDGMSRRGLNVPASLFEGTHPGVVITGAQHANETTGTCALLRALPILRKEYPVALGCIPMHNPEGANLYHQLRRDNPLHMLHAARYTALGNDIQSQSDEQNFEKALRNKIVAATGAKLHLNLHGYPSHEWTRPFSGYSPRGFELWAIPKGFFLIMRHQPGKADAARAFLEAITQDLSQFEALVSYNQRQLKCYRAHAGTLPFELINGFACDVSERENLHVEFELVTEYPDETSIGADFRLGHQTQFEFIRAAFAHLDIVNQT